MHSIAWHGMHRTWHAWDMAYIFTKSPYLCLSVNFDGLSSDCSLFIPGTLQYDDMVLCCYNLIYTSIPVIVYALLEQANHPMYYHLCTARAGQSYHVLSSMHCSSRPVMEHAMRCAACHGTPMSSCIVSALVGSPL